MNGPIAAIILAAGDSKRVGQPKLLLPFGNSTVIGCVLGNARESGADEVLVVLGCEAERIAPLVRGPRTRLVMNTAYKTGMLSSVVAGVAAVSPGTQAFMLIPGDQPTLRGTTIDIVLAAFRVGSKGLAVPVYRGRKGHPAIISMRYAPELPTLGGEGARGLLRRHPDDLLEIPVDLSEVRADMDTMDDYHRLRRDSGVTGSNTTGAA